MEFSMFFLWTHLTTFMLLFCEINGSHLMCMLNIIRQLTLGTLSAGRRWLLTPLWMENWPLFLVFLAFPANGWSKDYIRERDYWLQSWNLTLFLVYLNFTVGQMGFLMISTASQLSCLIMTIVIGVVHLLWFGHNYTIIGEWRLPVRSAHGDRQHTSMMWK